MMILATLTTAGAMLMHPMQAQPAPEPDTSVQIHLTCSVIVIKDADLTLDREVAEDDDGRSVFTIPELRRSSPKIFAEAVVLDVGDGTVVFTPGQAGNPVDVSASHGRATVISQPRILALAGQAAAISVGTEVTIFENIKTPDDEGFWRIKFGKRFEGFELSFIGHAIDEGVRLDPLTLSISGISDYRTPIWVGDGMSIESPIFTERRLETTLTLPADALAIIPISPMPDKSGFLIAAISARAIVPTEPQEKTNSPENP